MISALLAVDWKSTFVPTVSLLEIVLRGTLMYLCIFALLRFVLKREAGAVSMSDLLVMVLLADAAQNGMASEYRSVTEGVVLVSTILFWNYALDWLGYRFPAVERLLHPPPLPLIRKGRMIRRHMQHEMITVTELMTQLREQGVEKVEQVKVAYLEGDGKISVIPLESKSGGGDKKETAL